MPQNSRNMPPQPSPTPPRLCPINGVEALERLPKSFLIIIMGALFSSCSAPVSRSLFTVPDPLPLLQIVVDLDSRFERDHAPTDEPQTAEMLFGLMVPVTEDGYCLTAAHNLGRGKAMSTFESQIGRHDFGRAYTFVDLAEGGTPSFLRLEKSGGQIVTADKVGDAALNRVTASEGKIRRIKMVRRDFNPSEFNRMKDHSVDHDVVLFVPVREIKVWPEDDLALVKVPFPTPYHFSVCKLEAAQEELLMVVVNPGLHRGTLNFVTRKIQRSADYPLAFTTFNPLTLTHQRIGKPGDSGGPVIHRNGELVGINLATFQAANKRWTDLAVGLRAGPILNAIEASRSR